MRVIQKLEIQNVWKGKGYHHCECGNTVTSSIHPFLFVFAFKETFDWPEVSQRQSIFQKFYCKMKSSPSRSDVTELVG